MEEWKPIKGYELLYEVSNLGLVRSLLPRSFHRILAQRNDKDGYRLVDLRKDGVMKKGRVHRIVIVAFKGPPVDERNNVNHLNGIKSDNSVSNLEWVTPFENSAHAVKNDLIAHGDLHGKAKLTESQVREIILRATRESNEGLAREYGVKASTIRDIVNGKTWWRVSKLNDQKIHRNYPHPTVKLTAADVRQIVEQARTEKYRIVAQRFGVSDSTIGEIMRGVHWRNITGFTKPARRRIA